MACLGKLDGAAFTTLGAFAGTRFASVRGSSSNDVVFAGSSGLVRWDGNTLSTVDLGRTDLGPAWVAATGDMFVAAGHNVMRFDGTLWSTSSSLSSAVTHVAGAAANDVFAASDDDLFHWDGAQWSPIAWKASLPSTCPNARIVSLAVASNAPTGGSVLTTDAGCVGTYSGAAFAWVKRPVIVGSIVVTSATSIVGTASTGGVVTIQK